MLCPSVLTAACALPWFWSTIARSAATTAQNTSSTPRHSLLTPCCTSLLQGDGPLQRDWPTAVCMYARGRWACRVSFDQRHARFKMRGSAALNLNLYNGIAAPMRITNPPRRNTPAHHSTAVPSCSVCSTQLRYTKHAVAYRSFLCRAPLACVARGAAWHSSSDAGASPLVLFCLCAWLAAPEGPLVASDVCAWLPCPSHRTRKHAAVGLGTMQPAQTSIWWPDIPGIPLLRPLPAFYDHASRPSETRHSRSATEFETAKEAEAVVPVRVVRVVWRLRNIRSSTIS